MCPHAALSEDGLVSLQTQVEGMVLEVHVTETPSTPLTPGREPPSNKDAPLSNKDTPPNTKESPVLQWFHIEPAPLVELYSRYGSNVSE